MQVPALPTEVSKRRGTVESNTFQGDNNKTAVSRTQETAVNRRGGGI